MTSSSAHALLVTVQNILNEEVTPLVDSLQASNPSVDLTPITLKLDECIATLTTLETATCTLSDEFPISFAEQLTDQRWHDGKPIYSKMIAFGGLPNATTKSVAHGISNMETYFVDQSNSYVQDGASSACYLPAFSSPTAMSSSWTCWVTLLNVTMQTGSSRSGMMGFITLKYTKTSDTSSSPTFTRTLQ